MIDTYLLLMLAVVLFSTKILSIITLRLHLPQVVGALVAGILIGPAVFGLVEPNETISYIADIGVLLLLFSAGMETDFKELRHSLKSSSLIAVSGIIVSIAAGFGIALLVMEPSIEAFFIGVVIASSSTSITVEALHELGKLKTKSGTTIISTAIIDDIMGVIILAVVLGMSIGGGFSGYAMLLILLKIAGFFIFAIICGIGINKLFNYMYNKFGKRRRLSIFALAFCFLMAFLAEIFGLAGIIGAYMAGVALCNTRCVEQLETNTHVLSYMFFTPVFLANIGIHAVFETMSGTIILFTVLLAIAAMFSKVIGCGLGAKISRLTNKESLQVGTGMMSRGEITLIVASKGIINNLMDSQLFSTVIVVVLITVLVTPIVLKLTYSSKSTA